MSLQPQVTISWVDDKEKTTTTKFRILTGYTTAELNTYGFAIAQLFKDISTAKITDVSISVGLDLSLASLKTVATTFADWFTKLFVQARDVSEGVITKYFVPTFDEANISSGSDVANAADAEVIALQTLIEDGLADGGIFIHPVTDYNQNVDAVDFMRENFRKS